MRNEMDPNQRGFAQCVAFAMIIVVAIVMLLSHAVEKEGRTLAVNAEDTPRVRC